MDKKLEATITAISMRNLNRKVMVRSAKKNNRGRKQKMSSIDTCSTSRDTTIMTKQKNWQGNFDQSLEPKSSCFTKLRSIRPANLSSLKRPLTRLLSAGKC